MPRCRAALPRRAAAPRCRAALPCRAAVLRCRCRAAAAALPLLRCRAVLPRCAAPSTLAPRNSHLTLLASRALARWAGERTLYTYYGLRVHLLWATLTLTLTMGLGSSAPSVTAARSRSPVARWHRQCFSLMMGACQRAATHGAAGTRCAARQGVGCRGGTRREAEEGGRWMEVGGTCVPLPLPGGPMRMMFLLGGISTRRLSSVSRSSVSTPCQGAGSSWLTRLQGLRRAGRWCTSLAPPALTGAGERAKRGRRATRGPQGAALLSRQGVGGLTFRASAADMLERLELATATHQAR